MNPEHASCWPVLVLVAAVGLGACGTSGASPDTTASSTTTTPVSVTAPTVVDTSALNASTTSVPGATPDSSLPATTEPVIAVSPPSVSVEEVNAAVAEALPASGATFCGHRLRGFVSSGDTVTAYVDGSCESYGVADGVLELVGGQGIGGRFEMERIDGRLAVVDVGFEPTNEDDPSTVFPDDMKPTSLNDPTYPDPPLLQAAAYFGAVEVSALGEGADCQDIIDVTVFPDYPRAIAYWLREGRPAVLDPDGDARPCEAAFAAEAAGYFEVPLPFFPADLLCRDLNARGLDYATAVAYWLRGGTPDRMDADGNGIPCETVYPTGDVEVFLEPARNHPPGLHCRDLPDVPYQDAVAYWLLEGAPARMDANGNGIPCETVYANGVIDFLDTSRRAEQPLPSGLHCRDLHDDGWGFRSAVRYWLQEGSPQRMDADRDGIPCETVYAASQVDEYLKFDRIFVVE